MQENMPAEINYGSGTWYNLAWNQRLYDKLWLSH